MKINKIEILGFGKLQKYSFNIENNLTTLCEENGYGKSTICEFIKSMLYGLPKKSKSDFTREHYLPFNSKEAGGTIEIEYKGNIYNVVRRFNKNAKDDELQFYINNIEKKNFTGIVGEYIFGINKESFERTMFINSYDLKIETNIDINSKMGNYINNTNNDINYNDVVKKLDSLKKDYKPLRQADEKGKIAECQKHINYLNNELYNKKSLESNLEIKYKELDELNFLKKQINDKIAKSTKTNEISANFRQYDSMVFELENIKTEIDNINNNFKGGFVSEKDKNDIQKLKYDIMITDNEIEEQEKNKSINIDDIFDIDEKNLNVIRDKISYFKHKTSDENDTNFNYDLIDKYKRSNFNLILDKVDELNKKTEECEDKIENFKENIKPNKFFLLICIISIIIIIAGAILTFMVNYILSLICLLGVIIFGFDFIYFNKNNSNLYRKLIKEKDELISQIDIALTPYGFSTTLNNNRYAALEKAKTEYKEYLSEKDKLENYNKALEASDENIKKLNDELDIYFKKYNIYVNDYEEAYQLLNKKINEYNLNKDLKEKATKLLEELNTRKIDYMNKYNSYKEKYKCNDLEKYIIDSIKNYSLLKDKLANYNSKKEVADKFYLEKNLANEKKDIEIFDSNLLNEELNEVMSKKNIVENDIDNIELKLDNLDNMEIELETYKTKFNELNHSYYIISKTLHVLSKAEENIKNKYIKPVYDKINNYLNVLGDVINYEIQINENYELSINDNGIIRDYRHLSSGEVTLLSFCYRLAILDTIFNEKSFIIIDDLFLALDEKHFNLASKLIKRLAEDRQIIYFTCHSSRNI